MVSEAIYRHEYKYYINDCDCEMLSRRLGVVMKRDPHTGPDGTYLIRSLYFDNYNDRALLEKINGDNPRSKFRIRIYNGRADFICLEKKVKRDDLTQKLSARITKEEYDKIVKGDIDWMLHDGRGVGAVCADEGLLAQTENSCGIYALSVHLRGGKRESHSRYRYQNRHKFHRPF